MLEEVYGGEGGIRTPGARKGSLAFEASAIDHSATSPQLVGHLSKERWGPKAAIHGEKRRHSWNHVPSFRCLGHSPKLRSWVRCECAS